MTDPAITGALAQRKQLETKLAECDAKIKRLRAQLADINKFIAQWEKFSGQSAFEFVGNDRPSPVVNVSQIGTDSAPATRVRNPKKEVVAEAVAEILAAKGAPMMRTELFKALEERGIQISGADPEMVLSTMLWRAGEHFHIERLKGGGYWFSDRPTPGNDPPSPSSEDDYGDPSPDDEYDAMVEARMQEEWQSRNRT